MKRPTLYEGIAVALVASIIGTILFTALSWLFPGGSMMRLSIALVAFAYLLYLLRRCEARTGRVIVVAGWILVASMTWLLAPPLIVYLLVHIGAVWFIRSLYYHTGPLSALADLGLNGLSLAAAIWAMLETGSLFIAIWCFFLTQSLFVVIPSRWKTAPATQPNEDRFARAHATAEAALRRLTSIN